MADVDGNFDYKGAGDEDGDQTWFSYTYYLCPGLCNSLFSLHFLLGWKTESVWRLFCNKLPRLEKFKVADTFGGHMFVVESL